MDSTKHIQFGYCMVNLKNVVHIKLKKMIWIWIEIYIGRIEDMIHDIGAFFPDMILVLRPLNKYIMILCLRMLKSLYMKGAENISG